MNRVIIVEDILSRNEPEVYPNLKVLCDKKENWSYDTLRNRPLPCVYKNHRICRKKVIRVEKPKKD
jgi:hypothetical protein